MPHCGPLPASRRRRFFRAWTLPSGGLASSASTYEALGQLRPPLAQVFGNVVFEKNDLGSELLDAEYGGAVVT